MFEFHEWIVNDNFIWKLNKKKKKKKKKEKKEKEKEKDKKLGLWFDSCWGR